MIAFRYLHKKDKIIESRMIWSRKQRAKARVKKGQIHTFDSIDIQALTSSFLMFPSYDKETKKLKEYLVGPGN